MLEDFWGDERILQNVNDFMHDLSSLLSSSPELQREGTSELSLVLVPMTQEEIYKYL